MIVDTNGVVEERECQMAWFRPLYRAIANWFDGQVVEFIDGSIAVICFVHLHYYDNLDDYCKREGFGDLARETITELLEKRKLQGSVEHG